MKEQRMTVLIVEDNSVNRKILRNIIQDEYDILEAEDGKHAQQILDESGGVVRAILLDLVMPVMDGFEFLREMTDKTYKDIPVVVMTGEKNPDAEKKALDLGACDFVTKPYQANILRLRLHNVIARSQMVLLEELQYMAEHDSLTGLYNAQKMYAAISRMLSEHSDITFACIRFDINRFRLMNTFWGEREGDRFLCYVADLLRTMEENEKYFLYARIHADIFCICMPYNNVSIKQTMHKLQSEITAYNENYVIETTFGVYVIDDPSVAPETIYSRASMAARECKKLYMTFVGYYNEEMGERLLREQRILNEMQPALDKEEFVPYFQPKYNLKTGEPYGAEALVRWNHPRKGMISPGTFIPVFERNGFIGKLDYYMWDHVCKLLRKWIDEGLDPAPVSVNISRASMYNPNIPDILDTMVKRYRLSPAMLNLELTESAYMDSPEIMMRAVEKLQERGFVIMMDDFGSGYSSLNTLKDIPVDVLKIDIKFLEDGGASDGRNERILASVIRMAGWLELPVVVEGVETAIQKEFLESVGCGYVQGFYFAKPMPVKDYEQFIKGIRQTPAVSESENNAQIIDTLWTSNPQAELIFQSLQQPVAVYEYEMQKCSPLRVNDAYNSWFGYGENIVRAGKENHISREGYRSIMSAFQEIADTHETAECEFKWQSAEQKIKPKWIKLSLKYLGKNGKALIIFASYEDETNRKDLENTIMTCRAFLEQVKEKPRKLLVVDDSELGREIVKMIFEEKYEVMEAENGQKALEVLAETSEDTVAIILDIMMPVMDGREFLRYRNEKPEIAKIPVIVVSADNNEKDQLNLLALGVNDYITKPFVAEVMKRRVQNVIEYNERFHQMMSEYQELLEMHSPAKSVPERRTNKQHDNGNDENSTDSQHNS